LGDALRMANCGICDAAIAHVDGDIIKGEYVGGQWVHVELPASVHPALPAKGTIVACNPDG
jgi:hypothetical protein